MKRLHFEIIITELHPAGGYIGVDAKDLPLPSPKSTITMSIMDVEPRDRNEPTLPIAVHTFRLDKISRDVTSETFAVLAKNAILKHLSNE